MSCKRVSTVATIVSFVCLVPVEKVWTQSVSGAGTVRFIKIGEGGGSGTPQGNVTAAARFVDGEPVGVFRVRWANFALATVEVTCIYDDGDRVVIGGPVRNGVTFHPAFRYLYLVVEDNGRPVDGEAVDRAHAFATQIDFCDDADFLFFFFDLLDPGPISHGNFTIRDDAIDDTRPQSRSRW